MQGLNSVFLFINWCRDCIFYSYDEICRSLLSWQQNVTAVCFEVQSELLCKCRQLFCLHIKHGSLICEWFWLQIATCVNDITLPFTDTNFRILKSIFSCGFIFFCFSQLETIHTCAMCAMPHNVKVSFGVPDSSKTNVNPLFQKLVPAWHTHIIWFSNFFEKCHELEKMLSWIL